MKILIISPGKLAIPAVEGGAVETLIQILIDFNEVHKDFKITVVSSDNDEALKKSKKYNNTEFIYIKTHDLIYKISRAIRYLINRIPGVYIGNAFIKRTIKKMDNSFSDYDYVIIENQPEYVLTLYKNCKNMILHLHNDFLNINTDSNKKIVSKYKMIFAISNYINKRVSDITPSLKNVYTLYNGVDIEKFNLSKKKNYINDYDIKENDFVYLYTGRLVPEKGVLELVKAFNLIDDDSSKLLIVGDISKNSKYIKKVKKEAKNNANIIFTGKIKYKDIPFYYNLAKVGIIPSTWEEPFALTVIEHMSAGNPVIISNSGAMPELVDDECSIIVNKGENFINELSKSIILIKKKYNNYDKKTIKDQANKFNSEKYYKNFVEYINKEGKK